MATVTIPADTAPGSYFLLAVADGPSTVPETSETNNVLAVSLRVGPDLVVSSLSKPASVTSGTVVTLTDTTKNQGSAALSTSTTYLYFSRPTLRWILATRCSGRVPCRRSALAPRRPAHRCGDPGGADTGNLLRHREGGRRQHRRGVAGDEQPACDCDYGEELGDWCALEDSNLRPPPCEGDALPLSQARPGETYDLSPARPLRQLAQHGSMSPWGIHLAPVRRLP